MDNLRESFFEYFKIAIIAPGDDESLRQALHLRHQVYCVEHEFEPPNSEQLERDEYDDRSAHALLISRRHDEVVGTVRLVLPNRLQPDAPFPIEQHCGKIFDKNMFDTSRLPRNTIAEASRFAISKVCKKRLMDDEYPWGSGQLNDQQLAVMKEMERRVIPHITLGLILAVVRMSVGHNITHWYAVMEPALIRLLKRFDLDFVPIGSMVEYHGKRQPCVLDVGKALAVMERNSPEVWALLTDNGLTWPSARSSDQQTSIKHVA